MCRYDIECSICPYTAVEFHVVTTPGSIHPSIHKVKAASLVDWRIAATVAAAASELIFVFIRDFGTPAFGSMISMLQTKTAVEKLSPEPNGDRTRCRVDDTCRITKVSPSNDDAIVLAVDDGTERGAIGHASLIAVRTIQIVACFGSPFSTGMYGGKEMKKVTRLVDKFAVALAHARWKRPPGGKLVAAVGWIHWITTAVNGDMALVSMMLE
jgi:hypothetical protein